MFNFSDDFDRHVVEPYVAAHAAGRTPNPCIECNRRVKFARLAERARLLGFDAVATGHHARIGAADAASCGSSAAPTGPRTRATWCTCSARATSPAPCSRSATSTRPRCGASPPSSGCAPPTSPTARTCASSPRPAAAAEFLRPPHRVARRRDVVDTAGRAGRHGAGGRARHRRPAQGPRPARRRHRSASSLDVDRATADGRRRAARTSCCDDGLAVDAGDVGRRPGRRRACSCSAAPTACRTAPSWSSPPTAGSTCAGWPPQRRVAAGQSVVFYDRTDRFVLGGGIATCGAGADRCLRPRASRRRVARAPAAPTTAPGGRADHQRGEWTVRPVGWPGRGGEHGRRRVREVDLEPSPASARSGRPPSASAPSASRPIERTGARAQHQRVGEHDRIVHHDARRARTRTTGGESWCQRRGRSQRRRRRQPAGRRRRATTARPASANGATTVAVAITNQDTTEAAR